MNLKKLHHVAVIGSDYKKSKHFYVELLGFQSVREKSSSRTAGLENRLAVG